MTSLQEQFSAARRTQLDNGFNLMQSFSEQALDRTSRVVALQFQASRAAIEQSSDALRQLLAVRDPRDLLALGAQSQQNLRTMFNYGSELLSIAAGAGLTPLRSYSVDALNAITTANAAAAQQTVDAAVASLTPASPAAPAQEAASAAEPEADQGAAIAIVTSDVEPGVEPTAIARATSEVLDIPVAPPHPLAASVPVDVSVEIEVPKVEPVDATPPVVAPTTTKVTELRGTKGRRKQN
jgi:phasin family protein